MGDAPRGTVSAASPSRAATRRPPERGRPRRGALALLAVAVMLGLAVTRVVAHDAVAGVAPAGGHDPAPAYVVIGEGDTLWDLLVPLTPAGTDPAAYVAEVVAASGLDPRALQPGTVVRLP